MIVDDGEQIRAVYRNLLMLSNDFALAGTATDGVEAIDMALVTKPDLVLLDVLMPVMTGIEALPRLREVSPTSKIVFLTVMYGWEAEDARTDLHELGADDVIPKTLSPTKVLDRLRTLMQS